MKLLQMAALMSLLLVSLTGAAVAQAARELPFGDGKAAVTIPEIYQESFDTDGTLQLIELPHEAVRFYLSFHDTSPLDGGVAVRTIAKQKALSVEEIDGHVVATELGPQSTVEGKSVLNVHRMIGFQNSLIVLSTAIEEDRMSSPQVKEFFDHHLSAIIGSIRLAHARK